MENVTEALKIAAAVLIFVLALSISINAFGQVRQTSQIILDYKDREYDYTYVNDRDENGRLMTQRLVGLETIIPNIYKAYKENYKIVFKINGIDYLYEKRNPEKGKDEKIRIEYIDLEEESLGSEEDKRQFIDAILYGPTPAIKEQFRKRNIYLKDDGIYNYIKDKKFKESLGVYYQEEVYQESNQENMGGQETPDANKTKKRVITYSSI